VTNFDVGAFGFKLKFDSTVMKYYDIKNVNSKFGSEVALLRNNTNTSLNFAWSAGADELSIDSGKICDIRFVYSGQGSTRCVFF